MTDLWLPQDEPAAKVCDEDVHGAAQQDVLRLEVTVYNPCTVGGYVIACTKIIARGTSGDDFIHLKTSNIKFKVIL